MRKVGLLLILFWGACSLSPDTSWRSMVGGRTLYEPAYNSNGTPTGNRMVLGVFSSDAEQFTVAGLPFDWKSGTENHAVYEYSEKGIKMMVQFDAMSGIGGKATVNNGIMVAQTDVYFSEF